MKVNENACTKHYNWPYTWPIQRSSCFCSNHVSEVLSIRLALSNRDWEGRKHLLPVEEVHFRKTNSDFAQKLLDQLQTKTEQSGSKRLSDNFYWNNNIHFDKLQIPSVIFKTPRRIPVFLIMQSLREKHVSYSDFKLKHTRVHFDCKQR